MADINFSYADGTTIEQIIAFEVAAKVWESHLGDDVTVNIHSEVTDQLDDHVMGGALPAFLAQEHIEDVTDALEDDATTADDDTAKAHLPGKEVKFFAHGDEEIKSNKLNLTTANAKALGLVDAHGTALDGYVALTDLSAEPGHDWNYDVTRTNPIGSTDLDFMSVVLHEIGHILGFTSGLDDPGWLNTVVNSYDDKKGEVKISDGDSNIGNPLDLFRYSNDGLQAKGDGQDWSFAGDDPYLSIDGGATRLVDFAAGEHDVDFQGDGVPEHHGDGFQASHWVHDPVNPAGIFDGAITDGVRRNLTEVDLQAIDVIGWDRISASGGSGSGGGSGSSGITEPIRFEAEDLPLSSTTPNAYIDIQSFNVASGGQVWSVDDDDYWGSSSVADLFDQTGAADLAFNGPTGYYDVVIGYYDEDDGVAQYQVQQGNTLLDSWSADLDLGGDVPTQQNLVHRTVAASQHVSAGDIFTITATEGLSDHARIDYIDFLPVESAPSNPPPPPAATTVRFEAEDLNTIYDVENVSGASGGQVWSVVYGPSGETGSGTFNFSGQAGLYDVVVGYYDENDGVGQLKVRQSGTLLDQWDLDQNLGSASPDNDTFATRTVASGVQVNPGETFKIIGTENGGEYARVDYIEFVPVAPQIVRVEAEDMTLTNFYLQPEPGFSGDTVVRLPETTSGTASFDFNGPSGQYDIFVSYWDENDGASTFQVDQGTTQLDQWVANQNVGATHVSTENRTVATNLQVDSGDSFTLSATSEGGEFARIDYIEFVPAGTSAPTPSTIFETYYNEVVAELASQLGLSVAEVEANASSTYSSLTGNFIDDVIDLIENSEVYDDGWGGGSSGGSSGCGWGCQDFADFFHQRAFFSELPGASAPTETADDLNGAAGGVQSAIDELTNVESADTASTAQQANARVISGISYAQTGASGFNQAGGNAIAAAAHKLSSDLFQAGTQARSQSDGGETSGSAGLATDPLQTLDIMSLLGSSSEIAQFF